MAVRGLRRRRHRARGGDRRPGAGRPGRGRPPGHRPRRQGAHRGPAEPRLRHRDRRLPARPGPPRLPARRARRGARDRRQRRRRPRHHRRPDPRAGQPPAPAGPGARPPAPARRDRAPARPRAAGDREGRHPARHETARDRRDPDPRRRRPARARHLGARRRGVRDRLAAAARRRPVRQAPALPQAPRQDRLLHGRARPAGDPRRARDHPQDRALPGAVQARADVPHRAAELDRRRRPPAHDVRADHGRDRAAVAASTRTCRTSRSGPRPAARSAPASSRTPATCCCPSTTAQVELRVLAHIANEQVLRDIFARGEDVHTETAQRGLRAPARAARRRHALQGQDGQLRDRLRPVRLRPRRPPPDRRRRRRRSSSTATSRASRPSPSS